MIHISRGSRTLDRSATTRDVEVIDRIHVRGVVVPAPGAPAATAFAVSGGKFVAVGSDEDIRALAGPTTEVIDLGGRTVVPGFIETHVHPHMSGMNSVNVDAGSDACPDIGSLIDALAARAAETPAGQPVSASGFDDSLVAEDRGLTAADLDRASVDHPIVVRHLSGHGLYVNSFVLRSKGIDRDTAEPEGGVVVRNPAGEPTGEFREIPAMRLVVSPEDSMPTGEELDEGLRRALARMASVGVTTFHDMFVTPVVIDSYRRLLDRGELPLRARLYAGFGTLEGFTVGDDSDADAHDHLEIGGVKLISDGSIQLHTGALTEPYHDLGGCHCGEMAIPPTDLDEMVRRCHEAGRQVAIHTNGDRAIDLALDAIEKALAAAGGTPLPGGLQHRLEHVQALRDDQIRRMRDLGVSASVFVNHVYYWGDRHRDRFLGPERGSRISPLASISSAQVPFALHCDSPVTPVNPLFTMHTAVNRVTRGGEVLGPEERIDAATALAGYTTSAACLGGESEVKGAIAPGLFADFVVLDGDPTGVEPSAIKDITVLATVVAGRVVYTTDPAFS
ncbi:amidohydrolase family protein [Rhodococcus hoagii]|uniref:Amidohydrolase family protein n=1 Tax=Rhodococcus hoagii TaxID=43767 RepID=A0AAE4ZM07_RHOHA|nr:amidohydrolase family protein [Prescottella equi]MBM4474374.1 amidohydrolase family protein [Prescottella equi]MBM4520324.1 amidohydrolase family protein [Prescottella equi]MBM4531737.1 amidohydrolase family protein [Prescottella equi]MBM4534071.1 amidohydrolase family protein [Prescottella equi]